MSAVVDSSVIVAALVDAGPAGGWAENLIASQEICAPGLIHAEAANVLRRLELAKRITTHEANAAHQDLMELPIEVFPFAPFADRIWALRHTVTSYDAWYVALAEALGFPLATLDERLAKAAGPRCRFMVHGSR